MDDQARLYRSLVGGGRFRVLLDSAADARQVRPLLPATAGCAVLITSRRRLALSEGIGAFTLDALDERFGLDLLAALSGAERAEAQAADALRIVRSCGGFPLSPRIAAPRLAGRPPWPLIPLLQRLPHHPPPHPNTHIPASTAHS